MSQQNPTGTPAAGLAATDPRTVGPYRLVRRLGQGGMGIVYLGTGTDGATVAVKVVHSALADQPQFRARFTREVHAARSVCGTYTARVVGADTQSSRQWIATEYIPGPTLAEHIDTHGAMPGEQVRLLGLGLAEAIEAIHAAGLIHRDLKPSNIILSADGPKVIDFGISRASDATSLTQTGAYLGSLAWMSPEQVTGTQLTPATDAFSTGLLFAYAAMGHHPYGEGRPEAVAFRIVNQTPDLTRLPASLTPLVRRLLTADPHARPAPAEVVTALAGDTTKISDVTRIMTASWAATIVADPPQLPTPPHDTHTATAPAMRRRRRGILAAIGGLTAVAAATAAAMALGFVALPTANDDAHASTPTTAAASSPGSAATHESTPTADDSAWPDLRVATDFKAGVNNQAVSDGGSPPPFPTEVAGYKLSHRDTVTSRAFEDFTREVSDVPATMTGCTHQRFYVRWRSQAKDLTVKATWVYPGPLDSPTFASDGGTAVGNAGWMSSYGCTQPAFSLLKSPGPRNPPNASYLIDVVVEYQVWTPAV